jgi:hypothetical protein
MGIPATAVHDDAEVLPLQRHYLCMYHHEDLLNVPTVSDLKLFSLFLCLLN